MDSRIHELANHSACNHLSSVALAAKLSCLNVFLGLSWNDFFLDSGAQRRELVDGRLFNIQKWYLVSFIVAVWDCERQPKSTWSLGLFHGSGSVARNDCGSSINNFSSASCFSILLISRVWIPQLLSFIAVHYARHRCACCPRSLCLTCRCNSNFRLGNWYLRAEDVLVERERLLSSVSYVLDLAFDRISNRSGFI